MVFFKRPWFLLLLIAFIPLQYKYRRIFHGLAKSIREGVDLHPLFVKSIYFYTSDIILFCLFLLSLPHIKKFFSHPSSIYLFALMMIALLSIDSSFSLHYFRWLNVMGALLLFCSILSLEQIEKESLCFVALASGTLQAVLGIWQYFSQKAIGLRFFGEVKIGTKKALLAFFTMPQGERWIFDAPGVKKSLIRAHGTFPHPNIFGGFLVFTLLLSYYLFYQTEKRWVRLLYALLIFLQIFALALTYSRSALFALFISSLVWFGWLFFMERGGSWRPLLITVLASAALSLTFLYPQYVHRGGVFNHTGCARGADNDRMLYQKVAWNMIKKHPLSGVGFNNFTLSAKEYCPPGAKPQSIIDVHNIYLLIAAEVGLFGLLFFLLFLASTIVSAIKAGITLFSATLLSILLGYLFIGGCDFYLWTSQHGRLLFFLICGLIVLDARLKVPSLIYP